MTEQPSTNEQNEWTDEQRAALKLAIDAKRASRRSFLRHGVLSTAILSSALVLSPQEARAQGSGY